MSGIRPVRLLGFAPIEGLPALQAALSAVPGPELWTLTGDKAAAVLQTEPLAPIIRRGRKALLESLQTVQRRLEVACQCGRFLPMDPAAATAPAAAVARLVGAAWQKLAAALTRHGDTQQWDIILRWSPESVLATHRAELAATLANAGKAGLAEAVAGLLRADRASREATLVSCLTPAVLSIAAPAGAETEVALTVLVAHGAEAAMEAALESLSGPTAADATLDLRGPLPPLSFFALRLATVEQSEVASAWRRLGLDDRTDLNGLHRQWRQRAAALHPDRTQGTQTLDVSTMSDVTDAYRTLRCLLSRDESVTLPDLLARAGYRLILPMDDVAMDDVTGPAAETAARLPEAVT